MKAVLTLATHSFRGALRPALVASSAALLLGVLMMASTLLKVRMAEAGEDLHAAMSFLTAGMESALSLWQLLGFVLAIYLGASAISVERRGATLASLLSKPVSRYAILLGKLAGAAVAVMLYQWVGYGLCALLWLAIGSEGIRPGFYAAGMSAISLPLAFMALTALLARFVPALVAGSAAMLMMVIHPALGELTGHNFAAIGFLAKALFALLPASWPSASVRFAAAAPIEGYDSGLVVRLATENLLYTLLAAGLAAWTFAQREHRLR